MERGEFTACEAQLKSQSVYAETPAGFINVLDDDLFWKGLRWSAIAKYVRVQVQCWLDDGWAVSARMRRGLPERAMARHEQNGGCCGTCDELVDVLLAGDMKDKLRAVLKAPCVLCCVAAGTQRKDWLKGSARSNDRRAFCPKCLRAEWMLEHDWQVDFDAVLGSGTFGVVYRGNLATACMPIAVKCIALTDDMREEVRLQQMCAHARILRVLDNCESGAKGYVALEYCPHGDLSDLIRGNSVLGFDLAEMVGYMVDLLSAVAHVHRCGIVHRDIKPANILCQAASGQTYWQLRLADFGLAAVCPASGHSLLGHGTLPYMPVEQLLGFCNSASDVWASGAFYLNYLRVIS